jgi:UDP-N-acetylglucosamine 4-epimerase
MTTTYGPVTDSLSRSARRWVVTGVAGFIGSHLLEKLLRLGQQVVGVDNFATGSRQNLEEVRSLVTPEEWERFHFIEGDICDLRICAAACAGTDYVLHQAALGSVPRSIDDPAATHAANVDGFVNMLLAAKEGGAKRFVYASSSSVYGDDPSLPKGETNIGSPLSPYAASKLVDEVYARVFARTYGCEVVGLRYFNVFGPRQAPEGPYAAVIPKWFDALLNGHSVYINGDGETSRDFCYVDNAVQANLLSATTSNPEALGRVFNVAVGERTTLNELFRLIRNEVTSVLPGVAEIVPIYRDFRPGDVRHSLADVSAARQLLGYVPRFRVADGMRRAAAWYLAMSLSPSREK